MESNEKISQLILVILSFLKVRFLLAIGVYDEVVGEVLAKFPKFLTDNLVKKISYL